MCQFYKHFSFLQRTNKDYDFYVEGANNYVCRNSMHIVVFQVVELIFRLSVKYKYNSH